MNFESKAQLNSLRISPQKVRLVADLIRGMKASEALLQLQFSRKQAAKPLYKLVQSAIANASHNHKLETADLVITTIFVNEGTVLKRWMPRAMGRATPLRKRSSHITIVLTGSGSAEAKVEAVETTEQSEKQESTVTAKPKKATKKTNSKPRARSRAKAS